MREKIKKKKKPLNADLDISTRISTDLAYRLQAKKKPN